MDQGSGTRRGSTPRGSTRRGARRLTAGLAALGCVAAAAGAGLGASVAHAAPADVTTLVDDTGLLTVDVPVGWTDVSTTPGVLGDGSTFPQIVAAPDQTAFFDTYGTPGLVYQARPFAADTAAAVTGAYDFTGTCTDGGVSPYEDPYFTGSMQSWDNCEGGPAQIITLFVNPPDDTFSATLLVQIPTESDQAAFQTILDSFWVVEPVPAPTGTSGGPSPDAPTGLPSADDGDASTIDLVDDTGTLMVSVPAAWTGALTEPVLGSAGEDLPSITAAPDLQQFAMGTGAGMYLLAEPYTANLASVITRIAPGCTAGVAGAVTDYFDGYFTGYTQEFTDCDGTTVVSLAANAGDRTDYTVSGSIAVTPGDTTSVDTVLSTFNFADTGASAPAATAAAVPTATASVPVATFAPLTVPGATAAAVPAPTAPAVPAPVPAAPTTPPVVQSPTVTAAPTVTLPAGTVPADGSNVQLIDDLEVLLVVVPPAWSYVVTSPITDPADPSHPTPQVLAATGPDPAQAGVSSVLYFGLAPVADLQALVSTTAPNCAPGSITAYDDGTFAGFRQDFTGCAGGAQVVQIAATSTGGELTAFLRITLAPPADAAALALILGSFNITGTPLP